MIKTKTLKASSIKEKLLLILLHKAKIKGECIEYTGALTKQGYGILFFGGLLYRLHRVMFCILYNIPLNTMKEIHHTCNNEACFRSDHLTDLSSKDHRRLHHTKTHCIHGHEYKKENIFIKQDGTRRCLICYKQTMKEGIIRRQLNG